MRRIPSSYMPIYFWDGLLVEHLKEVPVHVIPCIEVGTEGQPIFMQSTVWGSIAPASWSFMLDSSLLWPRNILDRFASFL